jgi:putative ABC transport system permease protein
MDTLLKDLRYVIRNLLKRPGFTVIAVMTLALGIGANSAIFTVVNAVLLRPLPYEHSERLYKLNRVTNQTPLGAPTSPLNFLDWRSRNTTFEYLGGYSGAIDFSFSGGVEPEQIRGMLISDTLFPALGVKPVFGRNFLPEEDRKGANHVVILSHRVWASRFGSDPDVLGRTMTLDARPHTIVGVMPPDFDFPSGEIGLWIPFGDTYEDAGRGNFFVDVVGKLKPGVTREQAQSDMVVIAAGLDRQYPEENNGSRIALVPLHEQVTGKIRPLLLLLLGAVGFVVLIACANVGNLLLARATERRKEIAIRGALGASRSRIVRQLLSESAVLALGGGLLGLVVASWGARALVVIAPADIPRLQEISIDARVLWFTLGVAVLTCLLFGLAPALQTSRLNLTEVLKEGGRSGSGGGSFLRSLLVIAEVALALVLLIGGGLMVRSLWRLQAVNPGFSTENILTFDVALPFAKYTRAQSGQFFQQAIDRISRLPGVQSVGATTALPLSRQDNGRYFTIAGRAGNSPSDYTLARHRQVSEDYFQTLGMQLIKGRLLTASDFNGGAPVVVVNQAFARTFFPSQDPLDQRLKMGETSDSASPWMTVVGVVGDVKHTSLEAEAAPEIYRPFLNNRDTERRMTFAVRTIQKPETLTAAVRQEIQALDHDQPLANISTMDQLLGTSEEKRRFSLALLGVFALTALLLASMGIYGVISYTVSQGTREIGIRMALGAQQGDVLKLVVGRGLVLTLVGIGLGLAGAFTLTRLMAGLLFGVTPTDAATFITFSLSLVIVSLLASYVPARRATKVDPLVALRYE